MKHTKVAYFFWGPAGNGITTSLVKYATTNCSRKEREKALLLTNNDFTIGAKSKLKEFAQIAEFDYDFLPLNADYSQIERLTVYDKLFFDTFIGESEIRSKELIHRLKKFFHIKKVFVLNALLLLYKNIAAGISDFNADELVLTFMDYIPKIEKSKRDELNKKIEELSESIPLWKSHRPMVPEDFAKSQIVLDL